MLTQKQIILMYILKAMRLGAQYHHEFHPEMSEQLADTLDFAIEQHKLDELQLQIEQQWQTGAAA